ncbi:ArsR/SmtB family transcription factor [Sneathiella sp.]|uniref:ArsR/SmtB family transcription factor n=1 Tax=Sneathiella sp. TaxID=1964365 RepID=UPI00356384CC
MKEGPDISLLASLIGDPARANMLLALLSGKALTATELSAEAGVTIQTASAHLKKLEAVELLCLRKQGRHKYFTLADADVAGVLESLMGLAAKRGLMRTRTGPKDPALRKARVCYNHLAGELGVSVYDGMLNSGYIAEDGDLVDLLPAGADFVEAFGIDLQSLNIMRRPLCKSCLDWSARRTHLAGALGTAFLARFYELGWASRDAGSRVIRFTANGEKQLLKTFASDPQ